MKISGRHKMCLFFLYDVNWNSTVIQSSYSAVGDNQIHKFYKRRDAFLLKTTNFPVYLYVLLAK
jgi:hypothetical protein